jgi:hypothetical protein
MSGSFAVQSRPERLRILTESLFAEDQQAVPVELDLVEPVAAWGALSARTASCGLIFAALALCAPL